MVCPQAFPAGVNLASLLSGSSACAPHCNRAFCTRGGEGLVKFRQDEGVLELAQVPLETDSHIFIFC